MATQEEILEMLKSGKTLEDIAKGTRSTKGAVKIHIRRLEQKGLWPVSEVEQLRQEQQGQIDQPEHLEKAKCPITFESADDVVRFLIERLQDAVKVGEMKRQAEQKDAEIAELNKKLKDAQDKLGRLESGIAALKT